MEDIANDIREKHQIVLKNYHSANSNEIKDRLVEPIHFGDNYSSIMALDTNDKLCKQFKIDRIGEVVDLEKPFTFENLHKTTSTDIFNFTGDNKQNVSLILTMRAYLLLREEFPLSIPYVEKKEDHYYFNGPVASFEGVGRFVLGLIDEVKVKGSPAFQEYIAQKMKSSWR